MWYPGDEGGPATADLLLGRVSPAGRLPFTWPRRLEDDVANDPMHPERSSGGVDGRSRFSEGIFIGYRWFDRQGLEPLYPFGYGLSYTSFEYRDLALAAAADGGLDASFTLRNVGAAPGDEVPQVYLGRAGARAARRPVRASRAGRVRARAPGVWRIASPEPAHRAACARVLVERGTGMAARER